MDDRRAPHTARSQQRLVPLVECLDPRVLLSAQVVTHGLGQYISPAVVRPRTRGTPVILDAVPSLNRYLVPLLGQQSLDQVRAQAAAHNAQKNALLAQRVLAQSFIRSALGNHDTYTLLNSPSMQILVGFDQISDQSLNSESTRYLLAAGDISAVGSATTTVQVPPSQGLSGFFADVPTRNIRLRTDGLYSVDIPVDQIPANAPAPQVITIRSGELSEAYAETGPVLVQSLLTGQHRPGPNTPQIVRGLRMARYLSNPKLFPNGTLGQYLRLMRVAVERSAFQPTPQQAVLIQDTLDQFVNDVSSLQAQGVFEPPVPPPTPLDPLTGPALNGTLVISAGALRDLTGLATSVEGLPLLGIEFPGRIDAGFVLAPNGDYGLILTARGPLQPDPAGFTSDIVGGDVRVEVSDAASIAELAGLRVEEGTFVGTVYSGAITASRTAGAAGGGTRDLRILGASAGYGSGLTFGTGYSYTSVIPLGNLNALIPQYARA